ncbi:hypothetical protein [Allobranchiibius sp. CTAmp26]|uniref:hypothetical protein n=1 Tax=Allobranchiibius sp. CTAmp26 TaxID=2815214 RepID=UPI001AA14C3B|nr:hypothetical protein [Allobranchiibius sp. CTAmp26]MBO1755705.1 hypothetical protein [Allobranchiibius sp. CTAmp26]
MTHQNFSSDIARMRAWFDTVPQQRIDETKVEIRRIADEYAIHVAAHLPVGPSHRRDVVAGTLKASEKAYVNESHDRIEARVEVGGGTDYWQYAQAREEEKTFWHNSDEYIDRIERAIRDGFEDRT